MENSGEAIRGHREGSIISLKVHPSSSRRAVEMSSHAFVAVWVHSAPEKGKANKEALKTLSKSLGIPASRLELISGHTSRIKKVLARGLSPAEAAARLQGTPEKC